MRKIIFLILLSISNTAIAQDNVIYLNVDTVSDVEKQKTNIGSTYEYTITLPNNEHGGTDYYRFITNLDNTKSFEENGFEITLDNLNILNIDDLKKMNSCKIHNLFSSKLFYLLKKDEKTGKIKVWNFLYTGTSRNTILTKQKGKI